ncbi:MAG: TlpA family protein disulfide reductase [Alicyclobacillaceae bacterium]|nr:TlpA family protein disulfide reductase [Alicyclobacillaceae bacterium]
MPYRLRGKDPYRAAERRDRRWWRRAWAGLALSLAMLTGCGPQAAPVPGHQAPDFELPAAADNRTVSLSALLAEGKPLVLNAWASWCGPCKAETPALAGLARQYEGRVTVVGINMTATDSRADALAFMRSYHLPYLVLLDPKAAFYNSYQVSGLPTTFVVGRDGRLLHVYRGPLTVTEMRAVFASAARGA